MSNTGRFTPGKGTWYPLYRRLCGPQGRFGRVWEISPPPGFGPRITQPAASRYTAYAMRGPETVIKNKDKKNVGAKLVLFPQIFILDKIFERVIHNAQTASKR